MKASRVFEVLHEKYFKIMRPRLKQYFITFATTRSQTSGNQKVAICFKVIQLSQWLLALEKTATQFKVANFLSLSATLAESARAKSNTVNICVHLSKDFKASLLRLIFKMTTATKRYFTCHIPFARRKFPTPGVSVTTVI